jgi:hypothetical protein
VFNTPTTLSGYGITDAVSTDGPTLTINSAETGTGVAGNISGIKIERGILSNVEMVYDESIVWLDPATLTTSQGPNLQGPGYGSFRLSSADGATMALRVANINNSNAIFFEPGGGGTLRLGASIAPAIYISRMTDDNDIPNKKYVDDALASIPGVIIKAYAHVDVSAPINALPSFNVASVTSSATGKYDVTFTNALPNANYVVSLSVQTNVTSNHYTVCYYNRSTTGFQVQKFLNGVLDSGASGNFSFVIYQA